MNSSDSQETFRAPSIRALCEWVGNHEPQPEPRSSGRKTKSREFAFSDLGSISAIFPQNRRSPRPVPLRIDRSTRSWDATCRSLRTSSWDTALRNADRRPGFRMCQRSAGSARTSSVLPAAARSRSSDRQSRAGAASRRPNSVCAWRSPPQQFISMKRPIAPIQKEPLIMAIPKNATIPTMPTTVATIRLRARPSGYHSSARESARRPAGKRAGC